MKLVVLLIAVLALASMPVEAQKIMRSGDTCAENSCLFSSEPRTIPEVGYIFMPSCENFYNDKFRCIKYDNIFRREYAIAKCKGKKWHDALVAFKTYYECVNECIRFSGTACTELLLYMSFENGTVHVENRNEIEKSQKKTFELKIGSKVVKSCSGSECASTLTYYSPEAGRVRYTAVLELADGTKITGIIKGDGIAAGAQCYNAGHSCVAVQNGVQTGHIYEKKDCSGDKPLCKVSNRNIGSENPRKDCESLHKVWCTKSVGSGEVSGYCGATAGDCIGGFSHTEVKVKAEGTGSSATSGSTGGTDTIAAGAETTPGDANACINAGGTCTQMSDGVNAGIFTRWLCPGDAFNQCKRTGTDGINTATECTAQRGTWCAGDKEYCAAPDSDCVEQNIYSIECKMHEGVVKTAFYIYDNEIFSTQTAQAQKDDEVIFIDEVPSAGQECYVGLYTKGKKIIYGYAKLSDLKNFVVDSSTDTVTGSIQLDANPLYTLHVVGKPIKLRFLISSSTRPGNVELTLRDPEGYEMPGNFRKSQIATYRGGFYIDFTRDRLESGAYTYDVKALDNGKRVLAEGSGEFTVGFPLGGKRGSVAVTENKVNPETNDFIVKFTARSNIDGVKIKKVVISSIDTVTCVGLPAMSSQCSFEGTARSAQSFKVWVCLEGDDRGACRL